MANPKGSIALNADLTALASARGALEAMVATVKTDRFLVPVVESTHASLANSFDIHMDLMAEQFPERFHHVYEWRLTGDAAGRLWKHQLKGRGASNRFTSWAWKASKVPILTPQERADNPKDPMSHLEPEQVDSFSDRKYIFIWKAPVMEYNTAVHIKPKWSDQIAFPSAKYPGVILGVKSSTVESPGGEATTLAFTAEWARWWNQVAPTILESTIEKEIKSGIENGTMAAVKRGSRTATIKIHNMTYKAAAAQGYKWASENLHKFANSKAQEADWYDPEGGV